MYVTFQQGYVRCQLLTAASMKTRVFWKIVPCSLAEVDWRFEVRTAAIIRATYDGSSTQLWNVGLLRDYTALYPRLLSCSEVFNVTCLLTYLLNPWRYSSCRTLAASHTLCEVSWQRIFTRWGRQPYAQPPTWRTRVSLLVWHLPRNPSGMGGPTSSYVAADVALEFIGAQKPPHPATKWVFNVMYLNSLQWNDVRIIRDDETHKTDLSVT
jgi:hypothetical protein